MADINDLSKDVSIHNETTNAAVTTTTDGAKERLDVSSAISSDPTQYSLKFDYDATGDTVGTTDVELFSFTGSGLLDFVGLTSGSSTYEAIIKIDGTERLRITMADLGSALSLSNATNVPIWADTANKNFRFHPSTGLGFSTSFSVWARSTTGSNTIKHITLYRELA